MQDRDKPSSPEPLPTRKDGRQLKNRIDEWTQLLKELHPFPGAAAFSTDEEDPPHSIYSVFTLLVADKDAFAAVFDGPEFNPHALFTMYKGVLDPALEEFVGVLAAHRSEMVAARTAWRILAGNYTGSACPDRDALKDLTIFMNDNLKK